LTELKQTENNECPTKVLLKVLLDNETSPIGYYQQEFGLNEYSPEKFITSSSVIIANNSNRQ
jgi:hypothetical protein